MFMTLCLVLGMFDIFDKYGNKIAGKTRDPNIPSDTGTTPRTPRNNI